jgi:hypothetical protein
LIQDGETQGLASLPFQQENKRKVGENSGFFLVIDKSKNLVYNVKKQFSRRKPRWQRANKRIIRANSST